MKILIVLGHPRMGSFNHAIAEVCNDVLKENGYEIIFHDLYQEKFDPCLMDQEIPKGALLPPIIKKQCEEIVNADGIIVIHPNWWNQPPAILKGWMDRVIRPGFAYEFAEGGKVQGKLKAQAALVFTTSNTPLEMEKKDFGDPLELLWKNCVFYFCGVKNCYRKNFSVIITSSVEQRKKWLDQVKQIVLENFPPQSKTH